MFQQLTIRGGRASILWGYRTAAVVKSWSIKKTKTVDNQVVWTLTATLERVDAFQARQRPLLFTAPRLGGFWTWPVLDLQLGATQLSAKLGPLEH